MHNSRRVAESFDDGADGEPRSSVVGAAAQLAEAQPVGIVQISDAELAALDEAEAAEAAHAVHAAHAAHLADDGAFADFEMVGTEEAALADSMAADSMAADEMAADGANWQ